MGIIKEDQQRSTDYRKFLQIDGSHPLKDYLPEGVVEYEARQRKGGKVHYFNFELAKEMGLIPNSHSDEITAALEKNILDTFSIQIINEYDKMNGLSVPASEKKSGTYMATRYLQLQHEDKKGKNSGDGRSIWNGQIKHANKIWDISSCGTGATRLSPATSKYNKFFKTGDPAISYGCGYAELDEGITTALFSDSLKSNGIRTEQTLAIIRFNNNIAINVRAHQNLLRPSHFFLYLKQNNLESLRKITDYYIEQQRGKEEWKACPSDKRKYNYFLNQVCDNFSKMAATFEDEYIFCWLDWDGDNILMDGSLIDYGSIRQFGIFHHMYRFDDVDRFSTNILEQKNKTRYMLQCFAQSIDYIQSGQKKSLKHFHKHKVMKKFDDDFKAHKDYHLLFKMGFTQRQIKHLVKRQLEDVRRFRSCFSYFEKIKSLKGPTKVSDGETWDVVYNMRKLLRTYPQLLQLEGQKLDAYSFQDCMKSDFALDIDLEMSDYRKKKINEFQKYYNKLINECAKLFRVQRDELLLDINVRSQIINHSNRVTGDAITHITALLQKNKSRISSEYFNELVKSLSRSQNMNPDKPSLKEDIAPKGLILKMYDLVVENREGI